jgi:hypothetical protein
MPFSRLNSKIPSFLLFLTVISLSNIAAALPQKQQSDPSALAWAARAISALTGGIQINSATLNGTVVRGDANEDGNVPIMLQATGVASSEIDITTPRGTLSLLRSVDEKGRRLLGLYVGGFRVEHGRERVWSQLRTNLGLVAKWLPPSPDERILRADCITT